MELSKDSVINSTADALNEMRDPIRQGGGFLHEFRQEPSTFSSFITARTIPSGSKPFVISIYDTEKAIDVVSLTMMINPKDINIGQTAVVNSEYSRIGWINTLWGNDQATISASGMTSGFYYVTDRGSGGLTNFSRKNSAGYLNMYTLFSIFKNNGNYYMDGKENPTLFKSDGVSRVINVMDTLKISYDGSEYLGSFSSFSLSDVASNPFRMEYSFEFIVSSFVTGAGYVEGHVKTNDNEQSNKVVIAIQGMNTGFNTSVKLNSEELNKYFPPEPATSVEGYLRGGGEWRQKRLLNSRRISTVAMDRYLKENPGVVAKIESEAAKLGITKEDLIALINFESAGTWSPQVYNPYSSAQGIGQWTNDAAVQMAKVLVKRGVPGASNIRSSDDLIAMYDTTEKQVELFAVYAEATIAGGTTLIKAMQSKTTSAERLDTFLIGHFLPAYVGRPYNEVLPANIRAVNPGIRTIGDYVEKVRAQAFAITKATVSGT